jgi:hypothetical protein
MSQQALRGHLFRVERSVPDGGTGVPGTVGPQIALATEAGIGGLPVLKHMLPRARGTHPCQPHVLTLNSLS